MRLPVSGLVSTFKPNRRFRNLHSKLGHRRESKKLIKSLNIYHQAKRIQRWEVKRPRADSGAQIPPVLLKYVLSE